MPSSTCVILGAGFSHTAGLPLAWNLFDSEYFIPSRGAAERFKAVLTEWQAWKSTHPAQGPEQFLTELYRTAALSPVPWPWAVEFVAAILATPLPHDRGAHHTRYSGRITRPVNVPVHNAFWDAVLARFAVEAVITPNYDILAERGLRHRRMKRTNRPGVYYGGLPRPQVLQGTALPFSVTKSERLVELTGSIPLYKLHGSLNWASEAGSLVLYQDLRPAFRRGGSAQIVPPILEKEAPDWLHTVWHGARNALSTASNWLVCGYSLPPYDQAINELFADAASAGGVARVVLLDPRAHDIAQRWQAIASRADVVPLPGLPQALGQLWNL
jgi:hypothetical protein